MNTTPAAHGNPIGDATVLTEIIEHLSERNLTAEQLAYLLDVSIVQIKRCLIALGMAGAVNSYPFYETTKYYMP